jgi:hypothetical protein
MGTGVAPPASPPGIELSAAIALTALNTEILECSQTLHRSRSIKDENNVVKPHGRLVPVS